MTSYVRGILTFAQGGLGGCKPGSLDRGRAVDLRGGGGGGDEGEEEDVEECGGCEIPGVFRVRRVKCDERCF